MAKPEPRKYQRRRSYLGARIFFDHSPSTFDCLVKNFSDTGAQINIETVWDLPETFRLHIAKFNMSYECQTKWKTHNKLGVSYSSSTWSNPLNSAR